MAILKKFIGANTIGAEKIQLENDSSLVAMNQAGSAEVPLFKLDSADIFKLMKLPRVDASLPSPSDAKDVATKEYVDDLLGGGSGNGYAPLGVDGKIPNQYYSSLVITDVHVVADIAERDALTGIEEGDVAKVLDAGGGLPKTYIYGGSAWIEIESGSDVDSVNGYTGNVVLQTSDIAENGATNLYYTPARQAAIEAYADQAEADAISAANLYTDGEVAILEAEDLTFLKLDGSRSMTGAMNMGSFKISSLADGTVSGDAVNLGQLDAEVLALENEDLTFLKLDGSRTMTGQLTVESTVGEPTYLSSSALNFDNGSGLISGVQSVTFGNGGVVQVQGAQIEIGVSLNMSSQLITDVLDPVSAQDAATKAYVDQEVLSETNARIAADNSLTSAYEAAHAALEAAFEAEDLTFLKLDGTRAMTAALDMGSHLISNVTDPVSAQDAATKAYVDQAESDAISSANTYTDGQLDLLSVQQLVHETKTLGAGDLVSIDVGFAIQGQPWIQVGRVSLVPGDDFTISGTTITWAGSVAPLGAEALEAGDKLSIFYMKSISPFV